MLRNSVKSVKSVKTVESGEGFVEIDGSFSKKLLCPAPQYVRKTVAAMLLKAAGNLPDGFRLILHEGWRSYEKQTLLFERQRKVTAAEHPGWSSDVIDSYTHNFAAIPSRDPLNPSPHATGGAVDVSVEGSDMGSAFLEMTERSRTDYYDAAEGSEAELFRANRAMLKSAMEGAGFVNFPYEWWHYEYGIDTWAKLNRRDAIYGGKYSVEEITAQA